MGGLIDQTDRRLVSNRLIRAATALGRVTSRVHKREQGLTSPEFAVLLALGSERAKLTSSHIVDLTAMDKTKVSRAVGIPAIPSHVFAHTAYRSTLLETLPSESLPPITYT